MIAGVIKTNENENHLQVSTPLKTLIIIQTNFYVFVYNHPSPLHPAKVL